MTTSVHGDEAQMIAESALQFAEGSGGLARARKVRDAQGLDMQAWQQIAELGWFNLLVPEQQDGLGLDAHAACALLEAVGRSLMPEPLVPALAAGALLAAHPEAGAGLLAELNAGRRPVLAVPALASEPSAFALRFVHVPDCHAGVTLLLARGTGENFELRAIEADAACVATDSAVCVDGSPLATLHIEQSAWQAGLLIARGRHAHGEWERARDLMLLGYAAYLVGLMDAGLQIALDYMKVRKQFGTPIGSFQALQHRAASAFVDVQASRALVIEACRAFTTGLRPRAACAAKARASAAALRVTKECIQFHGAIGFADEHDIGLYLRRAMTIAARGGGDMQQKLRFRET